MNQRHPQPSSNNGRRQHPGPAKPARPGLHRRVHSYHNAHTQATTVSRTTTAAAKKAAREESRPTEEYDDMAGLPQFCTTCERQIIHPGNSTLYCSRACQRRDSAKPTPLDPLASPAWTPHPTNHYLQDPNYPDILPQRSPTVLRPLSLTFSDLHLTSNPTSPTSPTSPSTSSDHDGDATTAWLPTRERRPRPTRASTSTLPSLTHTPGSSPSNSTLSTSTPSHAHSLPHRPRPAPPPPGHRALKSADLVIPIATSAAPGSVERGAGKSGAGTSTSCRVVEAGGRGWRGDGGGGETEGREGSARGSLRQLFEHEAMMARGGWR